MAAAAAQLGVPVVLVEGRMGGDASVLAACRRRRCLPPASAGPLRTAGVRHRRARSASRPCAGARLRAFLTAPHRAERSVERYTGLGVRVSSPGPASTRAQWRPHSHPRSPLRRGERLLAGRPDPRSRRGAVPPGETIFDGSEDPAPSCWWRSHRHGARAGPPMLGPCAIVVAPPSSVTRTGSELHNHRSLHRAGRAAASRHAGGARGARHQGVAAYRQTGRDRGDQGSHLPSPPDPSPTSKA